MKNLVIKMEMKRIKTMLKTLNTSEELFTGLQVLYQQISNQPPNKKNALKYNVMAICKSKVIKRLSKRLKDKSSVIFEFINYDKAPNGLVIVYNEYKHKSIIPHKWEFFITRELDNGSN